MWGSYLAYSRAGVTAGLRPEDFVFLRYAVAGCIMLPWLARRDPAGLGGVGWGSGFLLALTAGPLFIYLGIAGFLFAPLAHGAVIQPSTVTLASIVAAWLLLGERLSAERLIGTGMIIAGLTLIAIGPSEIETGPTWIGDLLFVSAGLLWAAFTILLRHWSVAAIPATAAVSVLSAAFVVPLFLAFGTVDRLLALDPATLAIQTLVHGVFAGVLAIVAYAKAVEILGAAGAALFPALVPAAGLIAGIPIAGEMPSPTEWIGAAVTTCGLAVAMGAIRILHRNGRRKA